MRFINLVFATILVFALTEIAQAQQPNPFGAQAPLAAGTKRKATPLSSERAVRVIYGSSSWNKDPKAIDSASVILREGSTDKMVQVFLEETEPDSAVFSGIYSVRWENVEKLSPEFYVAPAELLGQYSEIKELRSLITNGKISRKPFIFRRSGQQQIVELYDTSDQARLAYQAFTAERAALALANKKIVADATVDANQLAESLARRQANAKAALERIRLEQIESQNRALRLKEFLGMSDSERARRRSAASQLARVGLAAFKAADYVKAEKNFSQALEMDPQNTNFYFQYGVTLYKQSDANRAIVFIKLSEPNAQTAAERSYYLGLAFLKLEDFPNALSNFTEAAKSKHPDITPSSEFYRGMILVDQKKFNDASNAFQKVLDTSKDPKLDQKAEQMLEVIQRLRQYESEKSKRWTATALLGEMYDSNVLLINDTSTTGGATDLVGYRSIVAAGFKYRPTYSEKKEFAVTFDALHIYTVDNNFKQRADLRVADPTLVTVTAPYTIKSVLFKRGNKLDIRPGYEMLMSSQENNTQKIILHSGFVALDDILVFSEKKLGTAKAELRYDSSQLQSSVGTSDATAIKAKLVVGSLTFLNTDRSRIFTNDFGFTLNKAQGDDVRYQRLDLSVGYISPWLWDVTYNAKLAYYYLTYPDQSSGRKDHDVTLSLSGSRKVNAVLTGALTGTYSRNVSNVALYDYSKYTVLASLSAGWDF